VAGRADTDLRVLDQGAGDPAANMALDEELLHAAAAPTLRLYGWRPAAVSIGDFQDAAAFADLDLPVVRRATGGGAIHHADELTFALALDAHLLPPAIDASYALLHDAVAQALADIGVPVVRLAAGRAPGPRPGERWCFRTPGRHDLVTARGDKLVGAAQRRLRRPRPRVLHHGSIVVRRPSLTPFAAAIADFVDPEPSLPDLRRALVRRIAAALALVPC
jgi:lipoate-protein ligase A